MKGYLATRSGMKVGVQTLDVGMPFPACDVTPALLQAGHVRELDADDPEYRSAVAAHGTPPDTIPASGDWRYTGRSQTRAKPRAPKVPPAPRAKAPAAPKAARKRRPARKGR